MKEEQFRGWAAKTRKIALLVLIPSSLFITGAYAELGFRAFYIMDATLFVEQSIDILAPRISPAQVLELRAQYRSIDNAAKFYELEDSLRTFSQQSGATLTEFQSIQR